MTTDLDEIKTVLQTELAAIHGQLSGITSRLDAVESKTGDVHSGDHSGPQHEVSSDIHSPGPGGHTAGITGHIRTQPTAISGALGPTGGALQACAPAATEAVQDEFESLRESVSKIRLNKECIFKRDKTGLKREDQRTYNVVNKCATYAETSMKLLSRMQPGAVSEADLNDLFLTAYAQMRYLQAELASLIVKGEYGPDTARLFRTIQRQTSVLDADSLDVLRSAVTLTAAHRSAGPPRYEPRRSGPSNWGSRYPGQSYSPRFPSPRYQYGSGYNNQFSQFTNRNVPPRRSQPDSDI